MVVSLTVTERSWVQVLVLALFLIEDRAQSQDIQVKTQINEPTFYLCFELKTRIYEENPIEKKGSLTDDGDPGLHVDTEVDLLEQRRLAGVVEVGLVEAEDGRLQLGRLREAELDVVLARPLQQLRRAVVLVVLLHLAPVLLLRGL